MMATDEIPRTYPVTTVGQIRAEIAHLPDDFPVETVTFGPSGRVVYRPVAIQAVHGRDRKPGSVPVLVVLKIGERF